MNLMMNPKWNHRHLDKVSYDYLKYILTSDTSKYFDRHHFSLVQYCNPKVLRDNLFSNQALIEYLSKDLTYLNIGMGGGFLEAVSENHQIDSVEWDKQEPFFRPLRKALEVDHYLKYTVSDIKDNSFVIKTDKVYDYAIFSRFFPINRKWCKSSEKFFEILHKVKPYCKGIIIFDTISNYEKEWIKDFEVVKTINNGKQEKNRFTILQWNFVAQN